MCDCTSCKQTNALGAAGFTQHVDPVKLARYARAKATGKIPADPVYTAHVAASRYVPNLEFTAAELKDRRVKVYVRTPSAVELEMRTQPDRQFPTAYADVKDYVSRFEGLNNLVRTA